MTVPTIATRIRERAASDPRGVALREKSLGIWQETTWAEYGDAVECLAHGLLGLGVQPGDRVAVLCENRPEWLVADAGAVAARAVTVGLDPAAPTAGVNARVLIAEDQEQVDKALALPGIEWVVYLEPRGLADYTAPELVSWPDLLARGDEQRREQPRLLDELAAEVCEDDPVAAGLSARDVNAALAQGPHPDAGPADFALCHMPLAEIPARLGSGWLGADAGVQVHFGELSASLMQSLCEVQPSLVSGPPVFWETLRSSVEAKLGPVSGLKRRMARRVVRTRLGMRKCRSAVSLAPLAPDVADWYRGFGIALREEGVA